MSWFRIRAVVLSFALVSMGVVVGACKSDPNNPYLNLGPTPTTVTQTFTGTLINSGDTPILRLTHNFTTTYSGTVTITLTDNQPVTTLQVGFGIGVWDATTSTCGTLLAWNNTAAPGTAIVGNALAGNFCIQVYFPDPTVIAANTQTNYTVTVTHY